MKHSATFKRLLLGAGLLMGCAAAQAQSASFSNIALGADVVATGPGMGRSGWSSMVPAPASSVTDGVFLAEGTTWDVNTVWWDGVGSDNYVTISLTGLFTVSSLQFQFDNNDTYAISFRDGTGAWQALTSVLVGGAYGMRTGAVSLATPVTASGFRIWAEAGDGLNAVSEFQALGVAAVPEPSTWMMLVLGAGLAAWRLRRSDAALPVVSA